MPPLVKNNVYAIVLQNDGSGTVDQINLSATKPEGWTVTFNPKEITSLAGYATQNVDVTIKPASKAIAGDYSVTLNASGKQVTAQPLEVRVTVDTPNIMGWVGVGIIVLVICAVGYLFMRFSRR